MLHNKNLSESWNESAWRKTLQENGKKENYIDAYIIGFKEGFKEWFKEGVDLGKEQIIEHLLKTGQYTTGKLAGLTGVSEAFVKSVSKTIK